MDNTGAVADHIAYDSFGHVISQTAPSLLTRYLYTGREYEIETGLYYYRARFYDPTLGKFIQRDPIGFGDGTNQYEYVGSNPVKFVDPSGLASVSFSKHSGYFNKRLQGAVGQAIVLAHVDFVCNACRSRNGRMRYKIENVTVSIRAIILIDEAAFRNGRKPGGESLPRVFGHEEQHVKQIENYYNRIQGKIRRTVDISTIARKEGKPAYYDRGQCEERARRLAQKLEHQIKSRYSKGFYNNVGHAEDPDPPPGSPGEAQGFDPETDPVKVGNWGKDKPAGTSLTKIR